MADQAITALSDIDPILDDCKILVRVDEGSCYKVGSFGVGENGVKFPLLSHRYKIGFYKNMSVTRVAPFDQNTYGFRFEPFQNFTRRHFSETDIVVYKEWEIHGKFMTYFPPKFGQQFDTMKPKVSKERVEDWLKGRNGKANNDSGFFSFEVELAIPEDFGEPGAILVRNNYDKELYVEAISLEGVFHFSCNSWIQPARNNSDRTRFFSFEVELAIPEDFGEPGAILVRNNYDKELYVEAISLEGVFHFSCNSWIQPARNNSDRTRKTPKGLKDLRAKELNVKRGDGTGLRLPSDRIYDYDTYNDLGNPDKGSEYARPILGGERNPHPRRCRTGRASTVTDVTAEKPVDTTTSSIYVPRDEVVEGTRRREFNVGRWKGVLHNIPSLISTLFNKNADLKGIYRNAQQDEKSLNEYGMLKYLDVGGSIKRLFQFETPKNISWDTPTYVRDDELGRQTLAGMNPVSIEKLKVFPPVSRLDPLMYGAPESDLKEEHIIGHLNGMSVQQAMDENKLFILDYHDIYLPFLERINAQEDRKSYGTRTIFFLTTIGTLKPIAIELSLPPNDSNIPLKQVLTPPVDATTNWLWQLGKAHLSPLHPVFKLLKSHLKHTLAINATARESLICAAGTIERDFSPGKYSMEMACAAYRDLWRFDLEGLPADLIRRYILFCKQKIIRKISKTYISKWCDYLMKLYKPVWYLRIKSAGKAFLSQSATDHDKQGTWPFSMLYLSLLCYAHSRDEEYLGDIKGVDTNWPGETKIIEAFYRFSMKIKQIENEIEKRNADTRLRNRCGVGVPPYELLIPTSEPGVTGRGVPNSITM
ncbi:Lipase/lipooxygenase, PLAT/LH2 [Artemisia annua]|uniref:Lipase/lipooxygenase, PLAT/LH2 n=1 Tax=Artemisia annua TaxID=35608 RepID=A0A2U1PYR5_ARTAN|nr:Lipase/lipooxygenase, PLAT/LH2 [Artemisia annua]